MPLTSPTKLVDQVVLVEILEEQEAKEETVEMEEDQAQV